MSDAPRARLFIGAALPLIAFPLAVAAYAVFVSDDHRLDRTIIVVWQDNQVALSLLAGVGLLATLGSSLLLFSGLQRSSAAIFGVIPLSALVSLVAVGLATWTVRSNLVSPAGHIATADLPFFVMAVTREGLTLLAAGLFVSLAILLASGFAQAALVNRSGLAGALVCLSGVGASVVAVQRLIAITDSVGRAVHSPSRLWLEELVHETSALGPSRVPAAALVVLLSVGVGVWIARRQVGLALPLVVLGIGAAIPAASLGLTMALVSSSTHKLVHLTPVPTSFVVIAGRATVDPVWVLGPRGLTTRASPERLLEAPFIEAELSRMHNLILPGLGLDPSLGLEAGSRMSDLIEFLEAAQRAGVEKVGLVGRFEVEVVGVAPEVRPLLEQLRTFFSGVELELVDERRAEFVVTRSTQLEVLVRAAEARQHPLRLAVRP